MDTTKKVRKRKKSKRLALNNKSAKKQLHNVDMFRIADDASPFMYREAYRNLRTNLEFLSYADDKKVIEVTSSISGEGKSCISVNLAYMLSRSGRKVVLVDGDLRKPSIHKYLRCLNQKGLASVVYGKATLEENLYRDDVLGFDVLFAGAKVPNPAELLGSDKMKRLIENLREQYDYVILDTSPVGVVTDAAVLSHIVDGVVYIVKQNYASRQQVTDAYKNLLNVHANVLGVVLNQYDYENDNRYTRHEGYYNYYYNYYETDSRPQIEETL